MKYICIKKSNNLVKGEVYDVSWLRHVLDREINIGYFPSISEKLYDVRHNGVSVVYLREDYIGDYLLEIHENRDNKINNILVD
jgi:hypothetical protein